ncbi:MAG: hypothetical protein ACOCQX_04740 [Candidatus Nanoarchaeia archaeon]
MELLFPSPAWFYKYNVILEFLFAIVTLIVAYIAFSIYKKTSQKYVLYFGLGFASFTVSYVIQSVLNLIILSRMGSSDELLVKLISVQAFNSIGLLTHAFFFTIGLAFLLFITFKEKRLRFLAFLILVSVSVIFASTNTLYMFYLISSIFLLFISWHYMANYLKSRKLSQLFVALAFLFLFFGHFHFLISVNHQTLYVIGKLLELLTYCFILGNFYVVYKK